MSIFYTPEIGVAGDFIPFYWEGKYYLSYLKDYRDPEKYGHGTTWFVIVTEDFVNFEDRGEAIPRGRTEDEDQFIFTGCAMEDAGMFHIFYTGHSEVRRQTGLPLEGINHAFSTDFRTWEKEPGFRFEATEQYEKNDWRDPFVFWNDEAEEWWMIIAGRKTTGPSRHRGCTALMVSKDLKHWEGRDPLWAPDEFFTHECPDLFRIGDWWYLVFSEFSNTMRTQYRMARSLVGPWIAPPNDSFDGRAYYAAKSAGPGWMQGKIHQTEDTALRYMFGWLPTREGDKDDGGWQWGGCLVAHEVWQKPDGTLWVRMPQTVKEAFINPVELTPDVNTLGDWEQTENNFDTDSMGRFSYMNLGNLPETGLIETEVVFGESTQSFGVMLRVGENMDSYYQVRLEPCMQRVVFDRWQRPGDQPFIIERPVELLAGKQNRLQVIVDGTCVVIYVNDEVALSCRMYDHLTGDWGLFACEGQAAFWNVSLKTQ